MWNNSTENNSTEFEENPGPGLYTLPVLVLQILNTILSSVSLMVFKRLKRTHRGWSKVVNELIMLSIAELVFGIGGVSVIACNLNGNVPLLALRLAFTVVNSAVCTRNLWIACMTLIRCLMISLPIRTKGLFTSKRVLLCFLLLCLLGLFAGIWQSCMCWDDNDFNNPRCILQYLLQAGVPVPMVILTSVVTLLVVKLSMTSKSNDHRSSQQLQCQSRRILKGRRRAMRLFLTLAITFSILETPSFVKFCLDMASVPFVADYGWILDQVNINLLALDSVLNFFMFVGRLKNFREGLRDLVLCRPATRERHNTFTNGFYARSFSDLNMSVRFAPLSQQQSPHQQYLNKLQKQPAHLPLPPLILNSESAQL